MSPSRNRPLPFKEAECLFCSRLGSPPPNPVKAGARGGGRARGCVWDPKPLPIRTTPPQSHSPASHVTFTRLRKSAHLGIAFKQLGPWAVATKGLPSTPQSPPPAGPSHPGCPPGKPHCGDSWRWDLHQRGCEGIVAPALSPCGPVATDGRRTNRQMYRHPGLPFDPPPQPCEAPISIIICSFFDNFYVTHSGFVFDIILGKNNAKKPHERARPSRLGSRRPRTGPF